MTTPAPTLTQPFVPVAEGLHRAICCDVLELGDRIDAFGKRQRQIRLVFQVATKTEAGSRMTVAKTYRRTMHEGSALRRDLEAWRRKRFTEPEAAAFDFEKLVGVACIVKVERKRARTNGAVYAAISEIRPVLDPNSALKPNGYVRKRDRTS